MTKIRGFIILLIFLLATTPAAAAAQSSSYAEALNHLGLFSGTENGYELSRVPTRAESLVMMLRLWGKEKEVLKSTYKSPFTDTGWESRYVSYAYTKGVVNGIDEYHFGGNRLISLE